MEVKMSVSERKTKEKERKKKKKEKKTDENIKRFIEIYIESRTITRYKFEMATEWVIGSIIFFSFGKRTEVLV